MPDEYLSIDRSRATHRQGVVRVNLYLSIDMTAPRSSPWPLWYRGHGDGRGLLEIRNFRAAALFRYRLAGSIGGSRVDRTCRSPGPHARCDGGRRRRWRGRMA